MSGRGTRGVRVLCQKESDELAELSWTRSTGRDARETFRSKFYGMGTQLVTRKLFTPFSDPTPPKLVEPPSPPPPKVVSYFLPTPSPPSLPSPGLSHMTGSEGVVVL